MGTKIWRRIVLGLFVVAILVFAFGLMMNRSERKELVNEQAPTGQFMSAPTTTQSAPAAEPPATESATSESENR